MDGTVGVNGNIFLLRWMYCDMDFSRTHRQGGVEAVPAYSGVMPPHRVVDGMMQS
jgi:hypothetical protein